MSEYLLNQKYSEDYGYLPSAYSKGVDLKAVTKYLNAHGYGDPKKGYRGFGDKELRAAMEAVAYGTQKFNDPMVSYGDINYNPWQHADEDNAGRAGYVKALGGRTPSNEMEYNAWYYPNMKYKGQYGPSLEDIQAQKEGKKPWKYQVTDIIAEKIKALGPNATPEQLRQLIESDPYMHELATAAMRRKQAIADGKGGYSYTGTPSAQYKDIDVEGLKWLGYDPVYGWQKLLCNVEYNDFLKNAQALIEQGRANERDLRAMLSLYPTLHALDQEAKAAGTGHANIPGKSASGYMGIDDEFLGHMKYDKRTGFDPLIRGIGAKAAERGPTRPIVVKSGGLDGKEPVVEEVWVPGSGLKRTEAGIGAGVLPEWEQDKLPLDAYFTTPEGSATRLYDELMTEYARENWQMLDNGEKLKAWLDNNPGLTLGQLMDSPTSPLAEPYIDERMGVKDYKKNLERWREYFWQDQLKEIDVRYNNLLRGVKEGEIRPFYAGVDDADLAETTPAMEEAGKKLLGIMAVTPAWNMRELENDPRVQEIQRTIRSELKAQEPEYIRKYGHAMPADEDAGSWTVINPLSNNPVIASILGFGRGVTLGLSDVVARQVSPEGYEGVQRIQATRPWATGIGELTGMALPMGVIGKGAGAALKAISPGIEAYSPILFAALEGGASFSVYNGISSVIAGEDALTVAERMLEGFGEGAAFGGVFGGVGEIARSMRLRKWPSKYLGREADFFELPKREQIEILARELENAKNDPKVRKFIQEMLRSRDYYGELYVTEEAPGYMRPREADMRGPMPNKSLRPKTPPDTPKVNTDLHSVPNGTTFDLAGSKWVKTTSNMGKTCKPILTTVDGMFQIIQHGDTFKVNRLADSRTGYVNIGEARSLPQAGKMVGDAVEAMGTRPGGAATAKGTGTGGSINIRSRRLSNGIMEGMPGKGGKAWGEGELINNTENVLDLRNAWEYREYIRDIEQQTGRKIPNKQLNKLAEAIKNSKFTELDKVSKKLHRKAFNNNKPSLVSEWEKQTGQKWPRYDKPIFDRNGEIARYPGECYEAHEIIPNDRGGPIEWWNIHPAKWPNEHQRGIHRASGHFRKIFYRK